MSSRELVRIGHRSDIDASSHFLGVTGDVVAAVGPSGPLVSQDDSERFLDPETRLRLDVGEQLSFMSKFWLTLGYEMPDMPSDKLARLEYQVAWHPVMHRLLPAPLLTGAERIQAVERSRVFPNSTLNNKYMGLEITTEAYQQVLADPLQPAHHGSKQFGLGYRVHDGRIVGRQEYMRTLLSTGHAVQQGDGRVWCYPLVDLTFIDTRKRLEKNELSLPIEPTLSPESLIALALLRDIASEKSWGEGKSEGAANEVLYELKNGEAVSLNGVATVGRGHVISKLLLVSKPGATSEFDAGFRSFDWRAAISGLNG